MMRVQRANHFSVRGNSKLSSTRTDTAIFHKMDHLRAKTLASSSANAVAAKKGSAQAEKETKGCVIHCWSAPRCLSTSLM